MALPVPTYRPLVTFAVSTTCAAVQVQATAMLVPEASTASTVTTKRSHVERKTWLPISPPVQDPTFRRRSPSSKQKTIPPVRNPISSRSSTPSRITLFVRSAANLVTPLVMPLVMPLGILLGGAGRRWSSGACEDGDIGFALPLSPSPSLLSLSHTQTCSLHTVHACTYKQKYCSHSSSRSSLAIIYVYIYLATSVRFPGVLIFIEATLDMLMSL